MQEITDWESLIALAREERRSGRRVPLTFPIEVTGLDNSRRLFVERTVTLDVSEAGCRFRLKTPVVSGEVVAIRLLTRLDPDHEASRPLLFEIAWVEQASEGWTAGAKKLQPERMWQVHFPAQRPVRNP